MYTATFSMSFTDEIRCWGMFCFTRFFFPVLEAKCKVYGKRSPTLTWIYFERENAGDAFHSPKNLTSCLDFVHIDCRILEHLSSIPIESLVQSQQLSTSNAAGMRCQSCWMHCQISQSIFRIEREWQNFSFHFCHQPCLFLIKAPLGMEDWNNPFTDQRMPCKMTCYTPARAVCLIASFRVQPCLSPDPVIPVPPWAGPWQDPSHSPRPSSEGRGGIRAPWQARWLVMPGQTWHR